MQHTLKSLLTTSVLTLPSIFGFNDLPDAAEVGVLAAQHGTTVKALTPTPTSNFLSLMSNQDLLDNLTGAVRIDNSAIIEYGFGTAADLGVLARINKAFAEHAQPVLKSLKAFIV